MTSLDTHTKLLKILLNIRAKAALLINAALYLQCIST